jgi:hypothetical protein
MSNDCEKYENLLNKFCYESKNAKYNGFTSSTLQNIETMQRDMKSKWFNNRCSISEKTNNLFIETIDNLLKKYKNPELVKLHNTDTNPALDALLKNHKKVATIPRVWPLSFNKLKPNSTSSRNRSRSNRSRGSRNAINRSRKGKSRRVNRLRRSRN